MKSIKKSDPYIVKVRGRRWIVKQVVQIGRKTHVYFMSETANGPAWSKSSAYCSKYNTLESANKALEDAKYYNLMHTLSHLGDIP